MKLGEDYYKESFNNLIETTYNSNLQYLDNIIKKRNLYETEINANQLASKENIEEAIWKENVFEATPKNTPSELYIDYNYNTYYKPIIVNLEKLINSETIQYKQKAKHYNFILEELLNYYDNFDKENLSKYWVVIESF